MSHPARIDPFGLSPEAVTASWPGDWPLAMVWSGGGAPGSRWTVIARPSRVAAHRRSESFAPLCPRPAVPAAPHRAPDEPPFVGGWIGWLSYDAGRLIEPRAGVPKGSVDDRAWPLACWARIDDALIHDRSRNAWWGIGAWRDLAAGLKLEIADPVSDLKFEISDFKSLSGRARYLAATRRIIEYIRAGDIYQANLAHRLTTDFHGSPRALFLRLAAAASPWYGGYLESIDDHGQARIVASASPELFLEFDPASRRLLTRPMKGTRPGAADPRELAAAEKDRAELNMIVDLMRNDLGRVCDFGSVRVETPRQIETHGPGPGLLQATAAVSGTLRPGLTIADALAAAFPGGSVTGAPKIRAMQVIDELEPVRRGPYCGCFGWIGDDGAAAFNILIRTALLTGTPAGPAAAPASLLADGTLDYSIGAGIVADSDPESEWDETLAKAGILRGLHEPAPAAAR